MYINIYIYTYISHVEYLRYPHSDEFPKLEFRRPSSWLAAHPRRHQTSRDLPPARGAKLSLYNHVYYCSRILYINYY